MSRGGTRIAPSILAADFTRLGEELARINRAGADWIHVDVMDGHFVPNITLGPLVVEAVKRATSLPLDVHLMIEKPERYIDDFVRAGAATLPTRARATSPPSETGFPSPRAVWMGIPPASNIRPR